MLEQIQGVPRGLICLCLSGLLHMTFVMGGISCGGSRHISTSYPAPSITSISPGPPDLFSCPPFLSLLSPLCLGLLNWGWKLGDSCESCKAHAPWRLPEHQVGMFAPLPSPFPRQSPRATGPCLAPRGWPALHTHPGPAQPASTLISSVQSLSHVRLFVTPGHCCASVQVPLGPRRRRCICPNPIQSSLFVLPACETLLLMVLSH